MSNIAKIVITIVVSALLGTANCWSAHARPYPLTRCGPDLGYFCHLHGAFDGPPFRYNLAIHPDCIRVVRIRTRYGIERRRVLVCRTPDRAMVWW